jgi:hypothetical protein
MSKLNKVLYDVDQSADTSAAERILARKNVGLDFDTEWTRGSAGGLATLDSSGLVPAEQLPSYVDDVIEGYYHDGKFYSDPAHAHEIAGELNKIYIDITDGANNASYRYTEGGSYIQISAQNTFSTISVDRGDETYDNVTADAVSDTVTLDRGAGIALDVDGKHITVGHTNSVTAGTAGSKAASTGNETLDVPWVDFDSEGHVTGKGTHTHTISTATNAKKGVVTLTDTIGSQDAATGGLGLSPKAVHSLGGAIYAAQYYNGADNEVTVRLFDIKLADQYANTVIRGQVNYTYTFNQTDCYGIGNFELVVSYNPNGSTKFNVLGNKTYWTSQGHVHSSTPEFKLGYLFDQATLKLAVYAVHIRRYHFCGINVTQATCEHGDMRKAMTFGPYAVSIPAGIGYLDNVDGLPTKVTAWSNTVSDANVPSEKLVKDTIDGLDAEVTSGDGTNVQVKVTEANGKITAVNITSDNTVNATDVSQAITAGLANYYTKTLSDGRYMQVSKLGTNVYSWPSATPTYNYVVLANFIQGHSTGTITEGSWITDVMSDDAKLAAWIWGDYSGYLVDSTVGSPMVDPRSPIDFSAYGVSNGTPYGLITCNLDDTNCRLIYDTTGVSKTSMTAEMWVFGCSDYPEDGYNTNGPEPLMTIGAMDRHEGSQWEDLINLTMYLNTADGYEDVCGIHVVIAQGTTDYNGEGVLFYLSPETLSTLFGTTVVFDEWVKNWHHYAICIDTSSLYFFIDGKKAGQMALSNNVTIEDHSTSEQVTHTLGEFLTMTTDNLVIKGYNFNQYAWDGGFAQVAVCNACKWTADFEVPTVAY